MQGVPQNHCSQAKSVNLTAQSGPIRASAGGTDVPLTRWTTLGLVSHTHTNSLGDPKLSTPGLSVPHRPPASEASVRALVFSSLFVPAPRLPNNLSLTSGYNPPPSLPQAKARKRSRWLHSPAPKTHATWPPHLSHLPPSPSALGSSITKWTATALLILDHRVPTSCLGSNSWDTSVRCDP